MKAKRPHKQQKAYCPYCRLSTHPAQSKVVVSLLYATGTACILNLFNSNAPSSAAFTTAIFNNQINYHKSNNYANNYYNRFKK